MKKVNSFLACLLIPIIGLSQVVEHQTFIYTSDDLADEITKQYENRATRGYLDELLGASTESAKGIASGYVTSFIDLGVNAIGSLLTKNSRQKQEWEKIIEAENSYQINLSSISEMGDFYKNTSFDGAMDPKGMRFDGIGCLRKENNDTLFYISCHIDRSKINRIIDHSKFELVLDTLIVSPLHSNLPNTPLDIPFSFAERKNFTLSMDIKIISSWMNEIVQLQKDQELGEFRINIPVDPKSLDDKGFLRYVRNEGEMPKYKVVGESFIVPRSFMGYRDENDNYMNSWGTGEYKLLIGICETCDVTDELRDNWKNDYKRHKNMQSKENIFASGWQTISNQRWDELSKMWVITTLKAPAGIITKDVIDKLGLDSKAANAKPAR